MRQRTRGWIVPGILGVGFNTVDGIAGHRSQGQSHQHLGVAKHHVLDARAGAGCHLQPSGPNTRGGTGHLHDVAPERLKRDARKRQSNQTFPAERGHFDHPAVLQRPDKGDNSGMRKVGM
jgi:hypothetical protein